MGYLFSDPAGRVSFCAAAIFPSDPQRDLNFDNLPLSPISHESNGISVSKHAEQSSALQTRRGRRAALDGATPYVRFCCPPTCTRKPADMSQNLSFSHQPCLHRIAMKRRSRVKSKGSLAASMPASVLTSPTRTNDLFLFSQPRPRTYSAATSTAPPLHARSAKHDGLQGSQRRPLATETCQP